MELEELGVAATVVVLSAISIYCKRNYFNSYHYRLSKPLPLVVLLLYCAYVKVYWIYVCVCTYVYVCTCGSVHRV